MAAADYILMTEATGQRIAAALEALSGTGAAAAAARANLDVYSKGETDNAISQSTANMATSVKKTAIAAGTSCTITFSPAGSRSAIISVIAFNTGKFATYIYEGYGAASIRQTITPITPGNTYFTATINADQSVTITPSEQVTGTYDVGVLMVLGNPPTIT